MWITCGKRVDNSLKNVDNLRVIHIAQSYPQGQCGEMWITCELSTSNVDNYVENLFCNLLIFSILNFLIFKIVDNFLKLKLLN